MDRANAVGAFDQIFSQNTKFSKAPPKRGDLVRALLFGGAGFWNFLSNFTIWPPLSFSAMLAAVYFFLSKLYFFGLRRSRFSRLGSRRRILYSIAPFWKFISFSINYSLTPPILVADCAGFYHIDFFSPCLLTNQASFWNIKPGLIQFLPRLDSVSPFYQFLSPYDIFTILTLSIDLLNQFNSIQNHNLSVIYFFGFIFNQFVLRLLLYLQKFY